MDEGEDTGEEEAESCHWIPMRRMWMRILQAENDGRKIRSSRRRDTETKQSETIEEGKARLSIYKP